MIPPLAHSQKANEIKKHTIYKQTSFACATQLSFLERKKILGRMRRG